MTNYFCVQNTQWKSNMHPKSLLHVLFSDTLMGTWNNFTSSPLSFSKLCAAKLRLLNAIFGQQKWLVFHARDFRLYWPIAINVSIHIPSQYETSILAYPKFWIRENAQGSPVTRTCSQKRLILIPLPKLAPDNANPMTDERIWPIQSISLTKTHQKEPLPYDCAVEGIKPDHQTGSHEPAHCILLVRIL